MVFSISARAVVVVADIDPRVLDVKGRRWSRCQLAVFLHLGNRGGRFAAVSPIEGRNVARETGAIAIRAVESLPRRGQLCIAHDF